MKGEYFGECFAGCGAVSKSIQRQGFVIRDWELMRGADHDLLKIQVYKRVKRDLKARRLWGAFLGPLVAFLAVSIALCCGSLGMSGAPIARLFKRLSRVFVLAMIACDGHLT